MSDQTSTEITDVRSEISGVRSDIQSLDDRLRNVETAVAGTTAVATYKKTLLIDWLFRIAATVGVGGRNQGVFVLKGVAFGEPPGQRIRVLSLLKEVHPCHPPLALLQYCSIPTNKYESSYLSPVKRQAVFLRDGRVGESNCGHFHLHQRH